ncbi:MAG: hypothetical protein N2517_01365 [Ignavibacteria bacterium]|nr:hypothetical protein [Ignavibacteria bacterium]
MKPLFIFLLMTFTINPNILISQFLNNQNVQVILQGKVTDEYTGNPVPVTIEFRTSSGKKFKIKSNPLTGFYQQVFNSGETIEVILYEWDVIRKTEKFSIPDTNKYAEFERNFTVRHLKEGLQAFKYDGFEKNSANLNSEIESKILELEEVLKFNRNVKFSILVNAHDTYYKTKKTQTVKKEIREKKKKKIVQEEIVQIIEPPTDKILELVDLRFPSLEKVVNKLSRWKDRIFLEKDYTVGDLQEIVGENPPDIVIVVKELKNILER